MHCKYTINIDFQTETTGLQVGFFKSRIRRSAALEHTRMSRVARVLCRAYVKFKKPTKKFTSVLSRFHPSSRVNERASQSKRSNFNESLYSPSLQVIRIFESTY